jgi:Taurine catabolism dioxygenase TauD, TfdA family
MTKFFFLDNSILDSLHKVKYNVDKIQAFTKLNSILNLENFANLPELLKINNFLILDKNIVEFFEKEKTFSTLEKISNLLSSTNNNLGNKLNLFNIEEDASQKISAKTNKAQPLHTDYGLNKPKYVAMLCLHQSQIGGESVIVDSLKMANYFYTKYGSEIFENSSITYWRKQRTNTMSIFSGSLNDISTCFSPYAGKIQGNSFALNIFLEVNKYLQSKENQIFVKLKVGEILIMDNSKVFHSRTEFKSLSGRKMVRIWIY